MKLINIEFFLNEHVIGSMYAVVVVLIEKFTICTNEFAIII